MTGRDILGFEKVNFCDSEKVQQIKESILKHGFKGCPILTYGNCLVTGSHRLEAIEQLYEEDESIDFECAYDVSDFIDEFEERTGECWQNYTDGYMREIFAGTWVEDYADQIREW